MAPEPYPDRLALEIGYPTPVQLTSHNPIWIRTETAVCQSASRALFGQMKRSIRQHWRTSGELGLALPLQMFGSYCFEQWPVTAVTERRCLFTHATRHVSLWGSPSGSSSAHLCARNGERFMKYTRIVVTRYGGPEVITIVDEECPGPMSGEVRVKVLAAGVSLPDVLAREGVHPETPRVPYTPGWDLVGVVDQIGEGVSGFELGQTVAAMPISGCYAQ